MVFKANVLSRLDSLSNTDFCPFTTHQDFMEILGLQYDKQLKVILDDNFVSTSVKPLVSELTHLALILFKLFNLNVFTRKSGRDRVTF